MLGLPKTPSPGMEALVHPHGPDLGELEGGHDVPELWPPMFAGL